MTAVIQNAETLQGAALPALLQLPSTFMCSMHPVRGRSVHVLIQLTSHRFCVFTQLSETFNAFWFYLPLQTICSVEKVGGQMTSADENYGFKLVLLNSFVMSFTIQKNSNRKQFVQLLGQLTQFRTPPSLDLPAFRLKQTSQARPANYIDYAARMGLEIVVDEPSLLKEVAAPARLRQLKFPESIVPAAVFPHILYYLQKQFERALFQAENQSNFRLSAYNADYKLCDSYPLLIPVPKAINIDTLRLAATSRVGGRFPFLSYTRRDAPCIFRAGSLIAASEADRLLFDSFATVQAAETVICDCRAPQKSPAAVYGTVKAPVVYFGLPEPQTIQPMYDEFAAAVQLVIEAAAIPFVEVCPRVHDAAFQDEMRAGLIESSQLEEFILGKRQLPPVSIAPAFARSETRTQLAGPPVFLKRLAGSGYLQLVIQYIQSAILVAQLFKQNKNVCIQEADSTDNSAVVAALTQMLLQPEFRTRVGFREIVEREFLAAGHKFGIRQGTFQDPSGGFTAPVFFCFLDCVRALLAQNPDKFAFDEDFLLKFALNSRSGNFGTFLLNSECERAFANIQLLTNGIWAFLGIDDTAEGTDDVEASRQRVLDEAERVDGTLHFAPEDVWIWKRWFFGEQFVQSAAAMCKQQ